MDLSTLLLFLVYLVNISLLIFIAAHKNRKKSWPFFWMLLLLALWQTSELLNITWLINKDIEILTLGVQAGLLPALFLAPAFIKLAFSLFDKWDHFKWGQKLVWYIPAIVMSFFVFTPYNTKEVFIMDGRVFYTAGPIYIFFAIYFVVLMSYGLYTLARHRKDAGAIVARQIDYIFIATALTALSGLLFNILLPTIGSSSFYYLGVNSTVFFTIILSYALFRYRFYDIKDSLYQALFNLFKLFVSFLLYYVAYLLIDYLANFDFGDLRNSLFLLVLVGLTAPIVFGLLDGFFNRFFVSPQSDTEKSLDKIAYILRSSRDLEILLARLSKEISKVVDYRELFIYLSKKDKAQDFYQVFPVGERLISKASSPILQYLAAKKKMANSFEIEYLEYDKQISVEFDKLGVDIALPIFYNKQLLGVLMIDKDKKLFSIQELNFLNELNKYLDIAVGSLLLYQQDMAGK